MIGIERFITGKIRQNSYVVRGAAVACLIVDPGGREEDIAAYMEAEGLEPQAILNTHAHFDHIGGVEPLRRRYQLPFYLHSGDLRLLKQANFYRTIFQGEHSVEVPDVDHLLDEVGPSFSVGGFEVEVIETPGHTPGGVSIRIDDALFTGDTLLGGEVGRVDLPGGNRQAMKASLLVLSALDPSLRIFPGHGEESTIGAELAGGGDFARLVGEAGSDQAD